MKEVMKKGWKDYGEMRDHRKEWVRQQYCQVCITVGSIYWTLDTEEVASMRLKKTRCTKTIPDAGHSTHVGGAKNGVGKKGSWKLALVG
eukprot:1037612-Amphidinium_carterae.3